MAASKKKKVSQKEVPKNNYVGQVENPDDFTSLGRICEIFLNNWLNTPYGSQ